MIYRYTHAACGQVESIVSYRTGIVISIFSFEPPPQNANKQQLYAIYALLVNRQFKEKKNGTCLYDTNLLPLVKM